MVRVVRVEAAKGGPNSRGSRKKVSKKRSKKMRQEFIEQDNEKDVLAAQMREAARRANISSGGSTVDEGGDSSTSSMGRVDAESFESKLAAVREEGAAARKAKQAATPTLMDDIVAGGSGKGLPSMPGKSIYDTSSSPGGLTLGQVGQNKEEEEGLNNFIRIGAAVCALGLLVVFLPSDDFISSPVAPQKELTPEVLEQVRKQASEYEKALTDSPEDIEKLKGAAESYVVLEDYAAAAPLLQKLLDVEPSADNAGNLADVWVAAGKPFKAAEVYRNAIDADWSGDKPSPSLLKGLIDTLDKDDRYGLSLEYVKSFRQKGYSDEVDAKLLEARVYSGWKGHGKEAEAAYQSVIDSHGDDFRGYLAKGVFMREIGKPDQADVLFRQAKSLAPKEMSDIVSTVIQQAKAQK